jgi:hypothetical protein
MATFDGLELFPSRFHEQYLDYLKIKFEDLNALKNSAISFTDLGRALKEIKYSEYGYIKKKTFSRSLNIEFSGIAASIILGVHKYTDDNRKVKKEMEGVMSAFKNFVNNKKFIEDELNAHGICLKIRFLFPYFYSHFAFSLVKAELEKMRIVIDKQNQLVKGNYDFEVEPPLTQKQLENSMAYNSQRHSLIEIAKILKNNPDIYQINSPSEAINTLQVRFTPLPLPLCNLMVNNEAFCDSYMYSQRSEYLPLSPYFPLVHVTHKKSKHSSESFPIIKNNFDYVWHHPLTMFCDDATDFTNENIDGLLSMRTPDYILNMPDNDRWKHKKSRIIFRKNKDARQHNLPDYNENSEPEKIRHWMEIMDTRFRRSTLMPVADNPKLPPHRTPIVQGIPITPPVPTLQPGIYQDASKIIFDKCEIGLNSDWKYFYKINLIIDGNSRLIESETSLGDYLHNDFCFLLHYAYATKFEKTAIVHKYHSTQSTLAYDSVIKILKTKFKKTYSNEKTLVIERDQIFKIGSNKTTLNINPNNIEISGYDILISDVKLLFNRINTHERGHYLFFDIDAPELSQADFFKKISKPIVQKNK